MLLEIRNTVILDKTAPRNRRRVVGMLAAFDSGQAKSNNSHSSTLVPKAEACVDVEGMKTDAGYSGCHGEMDIFADQSGCLGQKLRARAKAFQLLLRPYELKVAAIPPFDWERVHHRDLKMWWSPQF